MSGFFVSNSFGRFNSEATKKFRADLIDIPNAPATATFRDIFTGYPHITGLGYSNNWAKAGYGGMRIWEDDKQVSNNSASDANKGFPYTSKDWAVMRDDDGAGFYYKPHSKVIATVKVKCIGQSKSTNIGAGFLEHRVCKGKGGSASSTCSSGKSVKEAADSSSVKCIKDWTTGKDSEGYKWAQVTVLLDGSQGDYISVDMDEDISGYANFKLSTACGVWSAGADDPDSISVGQVRVGLVSIEYNVPGCTNTDATNYNENATKDNGSCTYTRATPTLTLSPSSGDVKEGTPVTISWDLDTSGNKGYSSIEIHDSKKGKIHTSTAKKSSWVYGNPQGVGTHKITVKTIWNKGTAKTSPHKNLNIVSAVSFIDCGDPNRAQISATTDPAGGCGDCNSGYYLGDDGLCTNCEMTHDDPYRSMDAVTGQCGDCLPDYAEHTDGTCQKVGCMTYADGTSAEDDYNYDPDAVTNDSSMCQGADGGNGGNGEVPEDIDCGVSDWSDWSAWSDATTSSGTRTRTRTVVTGQSGGGAGCPSLEETETGVVDPDTGTVTITTMGGDAEPVETTTETKSLAAPLIIGGIVLTIGLLVMRR